VCVLITVHFFSDAIEQPITYKNALRTKSVELFQSIKLDY
jgi:hypothetical protein